jgi:hypothetical protein
MNTQQPNRVTFKQLATMKPADVIALPVEQLALLQDDLITAASQVKADNECLLAALSARYSAKAAAERLKEKKDTGTIRLEDSKYTVVCGLPKNVDWDQEKLTELWERIAKAGDDPSQYLTCEYSMSETKVNALPDNLRKPFIPARTVKPGKPSFKLEPAKEAK